MNTSKSLVVRTMLAADRDKVANLIFLSTNAWYEAHARPPIFPSTQMADVFFDTYEELDPGCGLVVDDPTDGQLIGSCFYRVRPTHVSLGIMNAHPDYAGKGVARTILAHIVKIAEGLGKPVRLVSSAINLDSYSLYNRAGFAPRAVYQDMFLPVPAGGLGRQVPGTDRIRPATTQDLSAIGELDAQIVGIRRDPDYRFFLANKQGFWRLLVSQDASGAISGWMASSGHAGCNMIGPGVAVDQDVALALLARHLDLHAGRTPVFLVPATATKMSQTLYSWGARNCELHFQQVLGGAPAVTGVHMPTFLPESA